ncbi:MAG: glycosyltransferase family 4 protein [Sphingomonadaceae bacterium]
MKIAFALAGFHRYDRGAETALIALARALATTGDDVTLIGSGPARPGDPYRFIQAKSVPRERFERYPRLPALRSETGWEEATFAASLRTAFKPGDFDLTLTCGYPWTNWALRRGGKRGPAHVFVTQNGDWPAFSNQSEFRFFGCDGLVCINPDYYARNKDRWRAALIPNGIDPARFCIGDSERAAFGLPPHGPIVLMVSACIETKRVEDGIRAIAGLPDAHLVVAGDGPLRDRVQALADTVLPGRFTRLTAPAERMPALYRSADVFLHMSKEESFGNVYIEAMACGLPVVGHDSPRLRWIVGDDEYLADTTDIAATSARIADALKNGRANRDRRIEKAAAFAWPHLAAQYRAFFETVLAQSRLRK